LADAPVKDGLQWVIATPRSKDGQLQLIRIGFRLTSEPSAPMSTLEVLEILDNFGQRSVLTFNQFKLNQVLPASAFVFKPPVGSDVIKQ
jgi:outer membrane lipoprotein carrier protein